MHLYGRFFSVLSILFLMAFATSANAVKGLPDFTGMVEKYSPAVVNISTTQTFGLNGKRISPHHFRMPEMDPDNPFNDLLQRFFGEQMEIPELLHRDSKSLGSGFIISEDGYIITNHHVVNKADKILVTLTDKREFKAKLIGSDKGSDIALIKIDSENLPVVTMGKAAELKVGEWVLAIGSPFGFEHSVTAGIVSAKGRNLPDENYVPFIQTDVAINPGNSGGPLFNLDGEVVGVNSQIYSRSGGFMGLSFAIPVELAMNVVEQLKTTGKVARGYLGVLIQDVTHELAESFNMKRPRGALVAKVLPDSPAEAAGLRVGDIILRYNGQNVDRSSQLPPLVGGSPIDRAAKAEVLRDGKRMIIDVNVQQLPQSEKIARDMKPRQADLHDRAGLVVKDMSSDQRKQLGINMDEGVLVVDVKPGPARIAGIKVGDVITRINNNPINSTRDYDEAILNARPGRNLAVLVHREERALFIPLKLPMK
ncbi:MAG: DegQ family serine endoprotease [Gammaproteobacteria bacterium]|nr:DegQ family serine endoprotease [Gammaproteobacteria bacterium]